MSGGRPCGRPDPTTADRNSLGSTYGTLSQPSDRQVADEPFERPIATGSTCGDRADASHCDSCGRPAADRRQAGGGVIGRGAVQVLSVILRMKPGCRSRRGSRGCRLVRARTGSALPRAAPRRACSAGDLVEVGRPDARAAPASASSAGSSGSSFFAASRLHSRSGDGRAGRGTLLPALECVRLARLEAPQARHQVVEVDLVTIEVRPVDARELHAAAHLDAAAAAHAGCRRP